MNKSNDWMPLGQAYSRAIETERSEQLAKYRLVQVLKAGGLRHRVGHAIQGRFKPDRREVLNEPVPDGFFGPDGFWGWPSEIDWLKSEALRGGSQFYHAFRIEVSRADLERLWPTTKAVAPRRRSKRKDRDRVIKALTELGPTKIRPGMEPHEVETALRPHLKPLPSRRTITRGYEEFLAVSQ